MIKYIFSYLVRVGDHDLRKSSDTLDPQEFIIRKRTHAGFNSRTLENDLALITLDNDILFNGNMTNNQSFNSFD